jgi:hypothetical protein
MPAAFRLDTGLDPRTRAPVATGVIVSIPAAASAGAHDER